MDRRLLWFLGLLAPVLIWSGVAPHDRFTWFLEVLPIFIGLPIAFATQRRLPLSSLLLVLLWCHCVILIFGGHYTYARVPLGDWVMQWVGGTRNNYDKLGHFAQGFVPAILVREILLRTSPLGRTVPETRPSRWLGFLVVSVCLAFSACYELIEWWVAVASGAAADDFLGTQGYAWDTQSDMAWALGGAILALVTLSPWHDRSLAGRAANHLGGPLGDSRSVDCFRCPPGAMFQPIVGSVGKGSDAQKVRRKPSRPVPVSAAGPIPSPDRAPARPAQ